MHFFQRSKVIIVLLFLAILAFPVTWNGMHAHSAFAAGDGSWTTYLNANARTGFNGAESIINTSSASQLKLKWTTKSIGCLNSPGGPIDISVEPIVMQSLQMIFWGSWDGCEHATDLNGNQIWSTYIGQTNLSGCGATSTLGIASTATIISEMINGVSTSVVLVAGGDGNFYALNALTGTVIWKTQLGSATGTFLWSSPAFYKGSIYEGLASQGDCPLVQGNFFQLNAVTGAIQHTFNVVPNGCTGGSVWGSPTIDVAAGTVYIATGNPGNCSQSEPYAPAVVELTAPNLTIIGYWQVPASQQISDSDFGSTPTLFQATINGVLTPLVGVENKNSYYYTFARGNLNAGPVWSEKIGPGIECSTCSPSAWNGLNLFVAGGGATISGTSCQGTGGFLEEVNPATGAFLWQDCFPGTVIGAVIASPGLAVVGAGHALEVVAANSGKILFAYNDTSSGAYFWGPASISNGVLYIGSKNGNLYAFAP